MLAATPLGAFYCRRALPLAALAAVSSLSCTLPQEAVLGNGKTAQFCSVSNPKLSPYSVTKSEALFKKEGQVLPALVNPSCHLTATDLPSSLVSAVPEGTDFAKVEESKIAESCKQPLDALLAACQTCRLASGYRSYSTQKGMCQGQTCGQGTPRAKPGESQHQTGCAVDFCDMQQKNCPVEKPNQKPDFTNEAFASTACAQCLNEKGPALGWVQPYVDDSKVETHPIGSTYDSETWHRQYVGQMVAKACEQAEASRDGGKNWKPMTLDACLAFMYMMTSESRLQEGGVTIDVRNLTVPSFVNPEAGNKDACPQAAEYADGKDSDDRSGCTYSLDAVRQGKDLKVVTKAQSNGDLCAGILDAQVFEVATLAACQTQEHPAQEEKGTIDLKTSPPLVFAASHSAVGIAVWFRDAKKTKVARLTVKLPN